MADSQNITMIESSKPGILYLCCTRRNVFCTLVDNLEKRVKFSCSLGVPEVSHHSDLKNNYLRSKIFTQYFVNRIKGLGFDSLHVVLRGLGAGRVTFLTALRNSPLRVVTIQDKTLIPHNGCRAPKRRRKKFRTRVSFKIKKLLTPGS